MTSKERVLTAFAHREADRVPVNYLANPGIDRRLKAHYGLLQDDTEGLLQALGVDFRSVHARDRGPKRHKDIPERGVRVDNWGIHRRWIEHESGGYWDYCDFPLRDADEATIAAWPMPSPEDYDYRKAIRPFHQRFVDLAKHFGIPVMLHSCGSSSWVFEDWIEMGVTVVDTLQPEARNMSPGYLKRTFGGRLAFHGCISTAGPVAAGTVEETVDYCRRTLEVMMPGGGYCFAPTHCIQDNSPTENVVAMYETARNFGRY